MINIRLRKFSAAYTLLTAEQLQLKEAAAQFCDEVIKPDADEMDKTNKADIRKYFRGLGDLGMLGVTCPEAYGGSEMGYLEHMLIAEEVNRASGAIGISYGAHTNLCINQIVLNGTEEQKQKYLPKLNTGEHIGALAMSETGSGSDVMSLQLKAEKKDYGFILNGSKFWITNGAIADTLVVYARTDPKARTKGITAFLIEKDFEGFTPGPPLDKFGMRGSPTGELVFENTFVPEENVLGKVGGGAAVLMSGLNYERLVMAIGSVSLIQAALDEVMPYVTTRKQFGQAIGNFQLIQDKLAKMYTDMNSARCYLYTNAIMADKGEGTNKDFAASFLYASEVATQCALEAMQIFGGNGYINDYPLGRFMRDAKIGEIGAGTKEIRKILIAKELMQDYA